MTLMEELSKVRCACGTELGLKVKRWHSPKGPVCMACYRDKYLREVFGTAFPED